MPANDRARRYYRFCPTCRRPDTDIALIARSHGDGETALRNEAWACPHRGGRAFEVVTQFQDSDLDDVPVPLSATRLVQSSMPGAPETS